jgi:hypothetical protein
MTDTIYITHGKEKRALINHIKNIGLNRNGIIFGGLVRDEIIASHYRDKFINNKLNFSRYWDKNYHQDTIGRLIIPNDIDIYFNNTSNIQDFLETIKLYVNKFNGKIIIKEIDSSNLRSFSYNLNLSLNHTKVYIEIKLGRTISFGGVRISLEIDIISNVNQQTSSLEPPFYNVDFLSNVFVMEKTNGIINIRLSNCTGTILDSMTFIKKSMNSAKILDDIINYRTQFVRNFIQNLDSEYINCFRIIKMIDRNFPWEITNVPFSPITIDEKDEKDDNRCCICLEKVNNKKPLISITKSKNILHKCCFISYLKVEINKKYRNENGLIEIRCPFRNPFDFKNCFKNVNYI